MSDWTQHPEKYPWVPITDWARLAAYIDGEGTIYISRQAPTASYKSMRYAIYVRVTNTSLELMEWLKQTFGGTYTARLRPAPYKTIYVWSTASRRASWILSHCYHFLIIKQDRAAVAQQLQGLVTGHWQLTHERVLGQRGLGKLLPWVLEDRERLYRIMRELNSGKKVA